MKRGEVIARLTANERKLYAIARAMMGNEQDALDMISETACRAWRKAGSIREEEAVDGWLAATLVNCCKSALRRRKPQAEIDPEALPAPDETAAFDAREMVERLPETYRAIVLLRFFAGMKAGEIARQLDLPESTVRYRLQRALALLRLQLEEV